MFEKNWQILKGKDPVLASLIKGLPEEKLKKTIARDGGENLIDDRSLPPLYYHSNYSPKKETKKWIQGTSHEASSVFFIYGLGLGYSFDELQNWLEEKDKYLVFLEDDLYVIKAFMGTARAFQVLSSPKSFIIYVPEESKEKEGLCEELLHYFIQLSFSVSALPSYLKHKRDNFNELRNKLTHYGTLVNYASVEMDWHGLPFFQNFYRNLFELREVYETGSFKNKFKGVPAIICGAGPSLDKNFHVLEGLKDKALIFAGGSAVAALSNKGMVPHFGSSVDPNPEQFERMFSQSAHEIPIFFKLRVFNQSLKVLHGPKLFLGGANTYPISDWIEKSLNINGGDRLEEGFNVIHLLADLAIRMGCGPILFVGLDLAFTGMQSYANSVVDEHLTNMHEEEITQQSDLNDNAFMKESLYGGRVFTLWKWVSEANYTAKYAQEHPECNLINCTEGGLGIEGIPHMTLKDASEEYCQTSYDLSGWVQNEIQNGKRHKIERKEVRKVLKEVLSSLKTSSDICEEELEMADKIIELSKKSKMKSLGEVLEKLGKLEDSLFKEMSFNQIIEPTGRVNTRVVQRELNVVNSNRTLSDTMKIIKRWEISKKLISSYKETAKVSSIFINEALNLYKEN
jgi:hypothetical protein